LLRCEGKWKCNIFERYFLKPSPIGEVFSKNLSNHIFAFLANFFECWRLLIGCSAESTNQTSLKLKKNCQKGKNMI
jgi:hypothetical protein